jgi:hypothetical protein
LGSRRENITLGISNRRYLIQFRELVERFKKAKFKSIPSSFSSLASEPESRYHPTEKHQGNHSQL